MKLKLTWKIWLLIIFLVFSLISIFGLPPTFLQKGVLITSVEQNSTAFNAGLKQGQRIISIDGATVSSLEDFSGIIIEKYSTGEKVKIIIETDGGEAIIFSEEVPPITVAAIPRTNIKTGLDLAGGSRALIQAQDHKLSSDEMADLIDVIRNRLNVYGISDMNILPVSDLAGNNFMLIEIAGATPNDLEQLVSQQGKFEAKIGNETAFIGGNRDIADVCRKDATCAYISACPQSEEGYYCNFQLSIFLSEEAAQRHADITSEI